MLTLEYPEYYLVTCYTPNSQNELARLPYRMTWEDAFRAYLKSLEMEKPVIFCGDLNVAHQEIDLKNPKTNRKLSLIHIFGNRQSVHDLTGGDVGCSTGSVV